MKGAWIWWSYWKQCCSSNKVLLQFDYQAKKIAFLCRVCFHPPLSDVLLFHTQKFRAGSCEEKEEACEWALFRCSSPQHWTIQITEAWIFPQVPVSVVADPCVIFWFPVRIKPKKYWIKLWLCKKVFNGMVMYVCGKEKK